MDIISRKDAKAQGLTHYFTGKPCKHGHVAKRLTSKGICMDCNRAHNAALRADGYNREYYAKRMETDEEFRQAKRNASKRHYHAVMKHDADRMARHYEKCAEYRQTEQGQAVAKAAMRRFVESGGKAESDRRYRNTEKGKEVARAGNQRYMRRVAEKVGMPYGTYKLMQNAQHRLHSRLNTRIAQAIRRGGGEKSHKTAELTGCSVAALRGWLSSLFVSGMTWENYGEWHLEHMRPCASFDLKDEAQQQTCFNWRNLQPLWGEENIAKSDKWTPAMEADWIQHMTELGWEGELFPVFDEAAAA